MCFANQPQIGKAVFLCVEGERVYCFPGVDAVVAIKKAWTVAQAVRRGRDSNSW